MILLNPQDNNLVMRTLIIPMIISFLPLTLLAQNLIGTYDYVDKNGRYFSENMLLIKTKGSYKFCVPLNIREEFYDSIVNGEKIKMRRIVRDNIPCGVSYGDYTFIKRQKAVFIKIYDSLYKKTWIHRQYPLQKNDTTTYAALFSTHYIAPTQEGKAVYLYDTTILGADKQKYQCYVIQESAGGGYDLRPSVHKVFLDKRLLLPIRIEHYELGSNSMSYYLFKANRSISAGK